eukprot:COSAG06_NODE_11649_length_1481_cov_2.342258_2_plen_74_part_00
MVAERPRPRTRWQRARSEQNKRAAVGMHAASILVCTEMNAAHIGSGLGGQTPVTAPVASSESDDDDDDNFVQL